MIDKYLPLQIDAMKELVNIGGGHAATSISSLINTKVDMIVPLIEIMEYEELYARIMSEDKIVYSVTTQILGNGGGVFLFALPEESANQISQMMLLNSMEKTQELIESSIKELVNIIVNSFLNAISELLNIRLMSSIPNLTIDMFGSIISSLYMAYDQYDEEVLIIKNEFFYSGNQMDAYLYFIPETGVLEKLFKAIGL
ncbi:chemotaxis protein CheC [Vagococcus fluvialis]|jgi:chemotaxis protein CheC|uniref:Chemotaxis protein CheC n=1 Tax=Vagococcus fluvialis TaxID=2738 RepID=A0A369ATG7_9ENTE|nr:chemotaxis protein CheC [Vagococcus fluvialis]MBO0429057.1 chemotaxis protein CheC [Vagococcus fluvialis]MBO0436785.1 chemotaxis protein CheC [Vagococcus fluvialis]MBO0443375.1 chemotaxis protein CheC [Vagococcus fluvialis]MBO0485863.1 chemotaxis protein CheC [Vagococcus fluvialis]MCM2137806.1 chemotaxis protein CheC [Vagococcus fluvialis]